MKLTNYMRDAFIEAVMADVPAVDYQAQADALVRDYVAKEFSRTFPRIDVTSPEVLKWITPTYITTPGALNGVKAYAPTSMSLKGDQKVWKKLEALAGQLHRQQQTRSALKDRLRSVAYACSTRKALLAALPEFEKYLPEDEPAALRTLPVVANVVADFVKAGWPKATAPRQASAAT